MFTAALAARSYTDGTTVALSFFQDRLGIWLTPKFSMPRSPDRERLSMNAMLNHRPGDLAHTFDNMAHQSAKVLCVDDQPANLLALEATLDGLGLDLVKADSGQEALRCALKHDFALILMDV